MLPPAKTTFTGVAVSFERAPRTSWYSRNVGSKTAVTRSVPNQASARTHGPIRRRQRGTALVLVRQKDIPCRSAGGESGRLSRQPPGLHAHRVPHVWTSV